MFILLRFFLTQMLIFALFSSYGGDSPFVKAESNSFFQLLPGELIEKITSYLPKPEQEKMFFVNKVIFEKTYQLQKETRIQSFKNYLHYPYLSKFYKEITNCVFSPLVPKDAEFDIFKTLLQRSNNKEIFYKYLLKEANPRYFDVIDWCNFFNLIAIGSGYLDIDGDERGFSALFEVITFDKGAKEIISPYYINKILMIELENDCFDQDVIKKSIRDQILLKNFFNKNDKVRIIFKIKLTDRKKKTFGTNDPEDYDKRDCWKNVLDEKGTDRVKNFYKNITELGAFLFNELNKKGVFLKIIDRTLAQVPFFVAPRNRINDLFSLSGLFSFFEAVPDNECDIHLGFHDLQAQLFLTKSFFRKQKQNIYLRPYMYISSTGSSQDFYQIFRSLHLYDEIQNVAELESFFDYFCNQNHGLYLASVIRDFLSTDGIFSRNEACFWSQHFSCSFGYFFQLLSKYVSPYALLSNGYPFLDTVFDTAMIKACAESSNFNDFFTLISYCKKYGIDVNKYIYHGNETFLTYIFNKKCSKKFVLSLSSLLLAQGVDPFFKIAEKTLLEHFFKTQLKKLNNNLDRETFEVFSQFFQHQNTVDDPSDLFATLSSNGNTILHSYFKYAEQINIAIINYIMDQNKLNINHKNNFQETAFDLFLKRILPQLKKGLEEEFFYSIVDKFIEKGFNDPKAKIKKNKTINDLLSE